LPPDSLRGPSAPIDTKTCCARLYASDWARLLLGDVFHPGGLALTERLGEALGLQPGCRVLDLASGPGTSALHLARTFGCDITGVDFSAASVAHATGTANREGLADRVRFLQGDAEALSMLADGAFDAVICECAYCTFPDKAAAVREVARVLRAGGGFALSDVTRTGVLAPELDSFLAVLACIGDALPVDGYVQSCEAAGLQVVQVEPHDEALADLVHVIRGRLVSAELLAKLGQLDLPGVDFAAAKRLAELAADAIRAGSLGYSLIVASKPSA
jgi:arsenite methyltransferase